MAESPSHHMSHYSNLTEFHSSAAKHAGACTRALEAIWKARDGLPYLERQLEEARASIVIERLGEPTSINQGYIATVKKIAELMTEIMNKRQAIAVAKKQFQEEQEALQVTWNLISSWYVDDSAT
jgi:hypothetical protein